MPTSRPKQGSVSDSARRLTDAPWSRVRRVPLIRREIREYLPGSTVELLLSVAEQVVEGGTELMHGPASGSVVSASPIYASVMTTIDLQAAAAVFREPPDAATAQRVAELMHGHEVVRGKLASRATEAVAALVGVEPQSLEISLDYEVRADGHRVLLDADVEARAVDGKRSPRSQRSSQRRRGG